MSDSDSTVLENLKLARDKILAAISVGNNTVEYEIRGRKVKSTDPMAALKKIEELIDRYQAKIDTASGRARNLARMNRR